jgi:transposase
MKAYFDTLNEKDRRRYAAIEAMKLGHGGQNYISSVLKCHFQRLLELQNQKLEALNAYKIKESLRKFWEFKNRDEAEQYLKKWYFWKV